MQARTQSGSSAQTLPIQSQCAQAILSERVPTSLISLCRFLLDNEMYCLRASRELHSVNIIISSATLLRSSLDRVKIVSHTSDLLAPPCCRLLHVAISGQTAAIARRSILSDVSHCCCWKLRLWAALLEALVLYRAFRLGRIMSNS